MEVDVLEESIKVDMSGAGLTFSGSVSLQQAVEMLRIASLKPEDFVNVQQNRGTKIDDAPSASAMSLPELLNLAKPATSPETIATIAAWIMDSENAASVTRADVSARYRDARLPLPGNFPRDFSKAVQKGLLASVRGSKDEFYVTRTGRSLLSSKEST
jgi:hypothetical protein